MGTKVQCKSYFPGYYSMRDLNEDAKNGSWSLFNEEKMRNSGRDYDCFSSMPMDGYPEYDKEVLKQTMLKHEAMFRNQVNELHRLYRIQRALMDELQKKELYRYSAPIHTAQSDPFSSHNPCRDTQKTWKMPALHMENSSCSALSVLGNDKKQSSLNFVKDRKIPTDLRPTPKGGSEKDNELLDSKLKEVPRRTFDLELPADEYIVSEDEECIEEVKMPLEAMCFSNGHRSVGRESDVNLILGTGWDPRFRVDWKPMSCLQNSGHTHFVADLNEPVTGICNEEAEAEASTSFLGSMCCHEGTQGKQLRTVHNLRIFDQSSNLFRDNQTAGDHRIFSNFSHAENDKRQEQVSYSLEAGKSRSKSNSFFPVIYHEKSPTSTESTKAVVKTGREHPHFLSEDKSWREASFKEKATCGMEISGSPDLIISNHSALLAPSVSTLSALSRTDDACDVSPWVSSWRKPTNSMNHVPLAVEALPCVNDYVVSNMQTKGYESSVQTPKHDLDLNNNLRSHPSFGGDLDYHNDISNWLHSKSNASHSQFSSNGFDKLNPVNGCCSAYEPNEGSMPGKTLSGLHYQDVKLAEGINLNVCLPNGFLNDVDPQGDLDGGERKHEDPPGRISWFRTKSASNEPIEDTKIQQLECENKAEEGPPGFMKDFSSSLHTDNEETCQNEGADSQDNINNISFPVLGKPCTFKGRCGFSSSSVEFQDQSVIGDAEKSTKVGSLHANVACELPLCESEKQIRDMVIGKGIDDKIPMGPVIHHEINLNCTVPVLDISSSNDPEVPNSFVPGAASIVDVADGINLETPILSEVVEVVTPEASLLAYKLVTPIQRKRCEMEVLQDILSRNAAEAMVAMSSEICNQLDDADCHPSSDDLRDPLRWFSEVVSSNSSHLERKLGISGGRVDADKEASEDEEIDVFEAMTLELVETKLEDTYCCNKLQQEHENQDEDAGTPSPLLSRRRRRQTRRRRQRRDFQKDILPGLVSLSRHEVTEDLQMLEGLMIASGCSWETRVARRNMGRNGRVGQARGRGKGRGSAAAATPEKLVGPPPWQPREVEHGGISLQGWGKTTRRCNRRQRFPTANAAAAI